VNFTLDISYSEKDFIQSCIDKDAQSLKMLYEANYSIMLPLCRRYANNDEDALDILHDGFIKVFKNLDKYQVGTTLTAWIKRIMVNTAIDYYRKESKRRYTSIDEATAIQNNDPDVLSEMSAEEIIDLLQHLSPAYRSVFNMYVIEGYSHKELADILQITESTSRSNLVKARAKLKDLLSLKYRIGELPKIDMSNE
jgi:RNA polymerase sigma factor (sigma-70 family)